MLRGMATVSYWTADMEATRAWYTELLGIEPYFERPGGGEPAAYLEFRVGDYEHELGLIDASYCPPGDAGGPGGVIVYWAVDDVQAALDQLLSLGAELHQPVTVRGEGFNTASVIDPFGNVLGVMENPHYLDMLGQK